MFAFALVLFILFIYYLFEPDWPQTAPPCATALVSKKYRSHRVPLSCHELVKNRNNVNE